MGNAGSRRDHGAVGCRVSRPFFLRSVRGCGLATMGETVLVTGGTGFVGRAIIERLQEDGERPKALARSEASAGALAELGAEPVRGDVLDPDALAAAMTGCNLVYHAAGANAFCVGDPSPMFEVNVQGSE